MANILGLGSAEGAARSEKISHLHIAI